MAEVLACVGCPFNDGKQVVLLSFSYDPQLVALLKRSLRGMRSRGMGDAGGWLPDVRRWFVHLHCWPELRRGLLGAGCTVADGADPLTVAGALARAEGRATVELVAVRERVQRAVSGLRASGERPDVQRLLQDWAVQLEERGAPAEGHRTMLRLLEAAEGMLE